MPYVGKEPADIIATAVDTTTGDFSGNVTAGGTLGVTGETTLATHLNMGDSDKIKLGASGDLEVYHDGTHSYVEDTGTGELRLKSNGTMIRFQHGSETLATFEEDGTCKLFFDDSNKFQTNSSGVTVNGNIANSSGDLTLDVEGNVQIDANDNGEVRFLDGGTQYATIKKDGNNALIQSIVSDGDLIFQGVDSSSFVSALTLDMSEAGRAAFNTHVDMSGVLIYSSIGDGGKAIQTTASGSHNYFAGFFRNSSGTNVGSILVGTTSTAFQTSSDYRLKENVTYDFDATTRLKQLKPARFNFIADADTTVDGFLAHEVSSIVPEAITGEKDATQEIQNVVLNADGSFLADNISEKKWKQGKINKTYAEDTTWVASKTVPDYQSIDQSKLVPLLTKVLQEQQVTIESLTARITALESA